MDANQIIKEVIEKAANFLSENIEWKDRYLRYLENIKNVSKKTERSFNKPEGLSLYSSVSTIGKYYDLRFRGQSVATIKETNGLTKLIVNNDANEKYFDFKLSKDEVDWDSKDAEKFRSHFKEESRKFTMGDSDIDRKYPKSEEHRVENCLLREFSKNSSLGKALCNIQPITLDGLFFQMPTPLGASGNELKYANQNGGGIDILTRIKRGNKSHICVMEVKDENKPNESQKKTMSQAVSYAVFIAHLLRSKSGQQGQQWWDFFMGRDIANNETKEIPNDIDINVVTIMPKGNTEEYCNTEGIDIPTLKGVKLRCFSLYYDKDEFDKDETFKFSGTFKEYLD